MRTGKALSVSGRLRLHSYSSMQVAVMKSPDLKETGSPV